jgi:hypothetical protein
LKAAACEYGEVGDAADVVTRGQFRKLFGVDLEHDSAACKVFGDLRHMRSGHAARPTPLRPEINEYRDFAVAHNFVELFRVDLDGLSDRR